MKTNRIFASAFAALAVLASCQEKNDPTTGEATLTIKGETSLTLDKSSQSVDIEFVATRDWTAKSNQEWASVDPASGSASNDAQKLTITVLPNDGPAREAKVTLSIGVLKKTVTINQEGDGVAPDGTKENPFDVATAVAKCVEIGETQSTEKYYVKGVVSGIKNATGIAQYGNVDFWITADGSESETKLLVFQCLYLGGEKFTSEDQLKVGDNVVVYGPLVNYKGNTPETGGKGSTMIVKLNDKESEAGGSTGELKTEPKGTGTEADPFNAAAAIKKAQEVGTTASTEQYYIKGKIVSFKDAFSAQYGNMSFYISDDGTAELDQFLIFRVLSFGGEKFVSADQLKVGDEVVVKAAVVNYYGNTPETNQGGQVISVNGGQEETSYLSLSSTSREEASTAGSFEIKVNSNQSWTVASDSDWAKVSEASGEGSKSVYVDYTANTTGKARTAKITFTAKDGKTVVYTFTQLEEGAAVAVELTWTANEWTGSSTAEVSLEKDGYKIVVKKNSGSHNPYLKDDEVRAYANATVEVSSDNEFSSIVFALGDTFQYSEITADTGEVGTQAKGDTQVSWSGSSKKVVFTVGEANTYGSNSEKKNGQFRFKSVTIK